MLDSKGVNLTVGLFVQIIGARVKNDNGIYVINSSFSKDSFTLYKVLISGEISKTKYNIFFLDDKTKHRNQNVRVTVVSKAGLKAANAQVKRYLADRTSKEIVYSFRPVNLAVPVKGYAAHFIRPLLLKGHTNAFVGRYEITDVVKMYNDAQEESVQLWLLGENGDRIKGGYDSYYRGAPVYLNFTLSIWQNIVKHCYIEYEERLSSVKGAVEESDAIGVKRGMKNSSQDVSNTAISDCNRSRSIYYFIDEDMAEEYHKQIGDNGYWHNLDTIHYRAVIDIMCEYLAKAINKMPVKADIAHSLVNEYSKKLADYINAGHDFTLYMRSVKNKLDKDTAFAKYDKMGKDLKHVHDEIANFCESALPGFDSIRLDVVPVIVAQEYKGRKYFLISENVAKRGNEAVDHTRYITGSDTAAYRKMVDSAYTKVATAVANRVVLPKNIFDLLDSYSEMLARLINLGNCFGIKVGVLPNDAHERVTYYKVLDDLDTEVQGVLAEITKVSDINTCTLTSSTELGETLDCIKENGVKYYVIDEDIAQRAYFLGKLDYKRGQCSNEYIRMLNAEISYCADALVNYPNKIDHCLKLLNDFSVHLAGRINETNRMTIVGTLLSEDSHIVAKEKSDICALKNKLNAYRVEIDNFCGKCVDKSAGEESSSVIKYFPIDEELAKRSRSMWSFDAYVQGSETDEYRQQVDAAYANAAQVYEKFPDRGKEAFALADRYSKELADWINRKNHIDMMCPSVMITGASNFPVRKKEKQNAMMDTHMQLYKKVQGLSEKITHMLSDAIPDVIRSDDVNAVDKLKKKLVKLEDQRIQIKEYNRNKRASGGEQAPAYMLQNLGGNIRSVKERIEMLEKQRAVGTQDATDAYNTTACKVVENVEAARIQLIFEGKPSESIRGILKKHAFRWSPKNGAWQRQLNANGKYAAKQVLQEIEAL